MRLVCATFTFVCFTCKVQASLFEGLSGFPTPFATPAYARKSSGTADLSSECGLASRGYPSMRGLEAVSSGETSVATILVYSFHQFTVCMFDARTTLLSGDPARQVGLGPSLALLQLCHGLATRMQQKMRDGTPLAASVPLASWGGGIHYYFIMSQNQEQLVHATPTSGQSGC